MPSTRKECLTTLFKRGVRRTHHSSGWCCRQHIPAIFFVFFSIVLFRNWICFHLCTVKTVSYIPNGSLMLNLYATCKSHATVLFYVILYGYVYMLYESIWIFATDCFLDSLSECLLMRLICIDELYKLENMFSIN